MNLENIHFSAELLAKDLADLLTIPAANRALAKYSQVSFRNRTAAPENGFEDGVLRIYDYPENEEHDFKFWFQETPSYFLACFKELEAKLAPKYEIGRVRLMLQRPRTNLGLHIDEYNSFRLHIPVQTNGNAIFVSGKTLSDLRIFSFPTPGKLYLLDTTIYHSSINLDDGADRYHLLVNVLPARELNIDSNRGSL